MPITRVVVDSRQVVPGAVFVALAGERTDGHLYIGEALARGAIAVIAEARARGDASEQGLGGNLTLIDVAGLQPSPAPDAMRLTPPVIFIVESSLRALQQAAKHWRQKFTKLQTIGVTGSVGKSSTKELIYTVLKQKFVTLKTEGNLNSETGLPITLFNLNEKHQRAVLEMGMYALGEIRTLCEIARPRIGVVTNVGPSHIERLGSIENIARAKAELVEALPGDGYAILNGDDARTRAMHEVSTAPVFYYGLDPTNDLWADEIESHGLEGIDFALHYIGKHMHVHVPLLGRHSVHTALAAAAVGLVEKLSWQEILKGLQDVSAQLRLLAVPGQHGVMLLDDSYNASPHSTLAALNLLSELNGRKIVVLGDMLELGTYEKEGHHLVGLRAAGIADIVIAVGARGRMIGEAAQEAGHARVYFVPDNVSAVGQVHELAQPGDMILVKGSRGAQMEDIVTALALNPSESGGSTH
jgi:UDP-N-acetylmuramoyl-tripeptide--D-alanyl-D-alanine ligase